MDYRKNAVLALLTLSLLTSAAAQEMLVAGLQEEGVNRTFTDTGMNFTNSYMTQEIPFEQAVRPDDIPYKKFSYSTTTKEDSYQLDFQLQFPDNSSAPSILQKENFNEKLDLKKGETKSTLYNGSLQSDNGKFLNITLDAKYEHLILKYRYGRNSTDSIETKTDVYTGQPLNVLPVKSGNVRTYEDSGNKIQAVETNIDNRWSQEKNYTVVIAHWDNYTFQDFSHSGTTTEISNPQSWQSEGETRIQNEGLSDQLLIEDETDYQFKAYNITVPSDKQHTLTSKVITGKQNPQAGVKTYVLGSIGGTTTYTSTSGGGASSVSNDDFEDGDHDKWTTSIQSDHTLGISTNTVYEGQESGYMKTNGNNDGTTSYIQNSFTNSDITDGTTFQMWWYLDETNERTPTFLLQGSSGYIQWQQHKTDGISFSTDSGGSTNCASSITGEWVKFEIEIDTSTTTATGRIEDAQGNNICTESKDFTNDIQTSKVRIKDGKSGERTLYYDLVTYSPVNPNNPPIIDSINSNPTNWITGTSTDIGLNASDPDGDSLTAEYRFGFQNGTNIVPWTSMNTGTASDFKYDDAFTPTETGDYSLRMRVDDGSATNTSITNQTVTNTPPTAGNIDCYIDGVWENCGNADYNDQLQQVRIEASDPDDDDSTLTGTLTLTDDYDSNTRLNSVSQTSSDATYVVFDHTDQTLDDSGQYTIDITVDDGSKTDSNSTTFNLPWGTPSVSMTSPGGNITVKKYETFTMSADVTCSGGECASEGESLKVWADPKKSGSGEKIEIDGPFKAGQTRQITVGVESNIGEEQRDKPGLIETVMTWVNSLW